MSKLLTILLQRILNALRQPGGKNTISFSVFCMNSSPLELQSLLLMNLHTIPLGVCELCNLPGACELLWLRICLQRAACWVMAFRDARRSKMKHVSGFSSQRKGKAQ
jgi:hypothetical protein